MDKLRQPLSFTQVQIKDAFWSPRIAANRECGLLAVHEQLEKTGRLDAYRLDWHPGSDKPKPHVFWDSDVAKWLEGACYRLMTHQDDHLRALVDDVVDRILSAQGEDGYLNPHFTVVDPKGRWSNLRDKHELYCAGHLIEAAIAHHRATGDPRFLTGIQRYADLICRLFGPGEDQLPGYPGHEEIELALIKLYRHTGEEKYLNQAGFFIDQRGRSPNYFDIEARRRGEDPADYWAKTHAYTQSHQPVREQREVVGHAVRAMYLYSGMADLAYERGDETLLETLRVLWEDLTAHKLYLTGGIGPSGSNEGFTGAYDLPNQSAYAETCAAIGLVLWAQRLLQLDLNSRYADVLETALYNGLLSGVSLSGDNFFYVNPLASDGSHHRQPFFTCSCCPPNLNRLLPTVGGLVYSVGVDQIITHLYIQSEANFELAAGAMTLIQETDYPWDGVVCIRCVVDAPMFFDLQFRWPGWCHTAHIYLNDVPLEVERPDNGYLSIARNWHMGDEVRLQWVMPARRVYAHPAVQADVGKVALMRGPLVFCVEGADQTVPVEHLHLPRQGALEARFEPDLLGGVVNLVGTAKAVDIDAWGHSLYRDQAPPLRDAPFKAIPYFAWDNRQPGAMRVWLPEIV